MKYSTIKLLELITVVDFTIIFIIFANTEDSISSTRWVLTAIGFAVLFLIPAFFLERVERRQYPQWHNIWKIPMPLIAVMALIIAVTLAVEFLFDDISLVWIVILMAYTRGFADYYYAKKYDLDSLFSLEDLLKKYPEAREKLRDIVLG